MRDAPTPPNPGTMPRTQPSPAMPDARRRRDSTRLAMVCGFALAASMALPATAYALAPTGLSVPSASARPAELSQARPLTLSAALPAVRAAGGRPGAVLRVADEVTKFYVVKTPAENGGEPDILFNIAARTLGDGNRFDEILVLNTGRVLPNGEIFASPDQTTPGFALLLPADAEGPDVQFGVLPEEPVAGDTAGAPAQNPSAAPSPAQSTPATAVNNSRSANPFASIGDRVSLPVLIGGVGGVAGLTVMIVARRPLGRAARRTGSGIARGARVLRPRLPRGMALALRRRRRGVLARRLAADSRTPVMVRQALRELVRADQPGAGGPVRVYSVQAEPAKLLASVSGAAEAPSPWTAVAPTSWERAGLPTVIEADSPDDAPDLPLLARVGINDRGAQVMVDLGQINGSLSVRGDLGVAQDTVAMLVRGLLELPRQGTVVVAVDPNATVLPGVHGLVRVPSVAEVKGRAPAEVLSAAEELGVGLVRGAGRTGEATGLIMLLQPSTGDEARALAELATPDGGGWIVLTVGDVPGAHWRWYAEPDGTVDLGVLGLRVTVPTQALAGIGSGRV